MQRTCPCGEKVRLGADLQVKKCDRCRALNHIYREYVTSAGKRDLSFSLDMDEFLVLISANCHYCGRPPAERCINSKSFSAQFSLAGVDRKDNAVGYEAYNCVTCCRPCNRAKSDTPYQDYLDLILRTAIHQGFVKAEPIDQPTIAL
jgi:5-methylcytosine-specific restriction endonuclease McrA